MKTNRKVFLIGAGASAMTTAMRFPGDAAEFSYKWGNDWPRDHPVTVRSIEVAQKISKDSNGRMEVRVFPSNQLGSSVAMITQVRSGALEFLASTYGILEGSIPAVGMVALPFIFPGHKEAWDAMDGPFGKMIRSSIAKAGLFPFERSWDGAFRIVSNNVRPIRVPADIRGLKIRVPASNTWTSTFRALGASPSSIDGAEVYTACQTHIVDGTDFPLATIETYKVYEVQKYASLTNQSWTGYAMLGNGNAWERLPGDLKDIVAHNFDAGALLERADIAKLDTTVSATLTTQGMTINSVDLGPFKETVRAAGLYAQAKTQYGADAFAVLERTVGKLS